MSANYPDDRLYHREALWLKLLENGEALVGVNHHAQKQLGKIMFVDLPRVGASIKRDTPLGTIESSKAVSDMIAPANGKVLEVNPNLRRAPGLVNQDPNGDAWMLRVSLSNQEEDSKHLYGAPAYMALMGLTE